MLCDQRPLGSLTVKRDEKEELMIIICNQVLANTPMHKELLGQAWYTAPRMFGYGAQMRKLEQHDNQFKQHMSPSHAAVMGKTQNRHPSDVTDTSHGSPLDKEETSSHCVVLIKEQQPNSTTKSNVRPKEIAAAAPASTKAGIKHTMQELPVPRALQASRTTRNGGRVCSASHDHSHPAAGRQGCASSAIYG